MRPSVRVPCFLAGGAWCAAHCRAGAHNACLARPAGELLWEASADSLGSCAGRLRARPLFLGTCSTTPPQVLGEQRLVLLLVGLALDPDWCSNASVAYASVGDCC